MEKIKNTEKITKRKRDKSLNKRWTDDEVKTLLEYLQEQSDFEKPTAQIFYKKCIQRTGIDASWELVRWKVKNMKNVYAKAENWRKSTDGGLLEKDDVSLQEKLRKICRFYDELHSLFGGKIVDTVKKDAPKNALDQLSAIQSERNKLLQLRFEFKKEKFRKEFEFKEKEFQLRERQFEESVKEKREDFELKKLEMEKEERLRRFELELKYTYTTRE